MYNTRGVQLRISYDNSDIYRWKRLHKDILFTWFTTVDNNYNIQIT